MHLKESKKHILVTRFPYESILSGEEWHTISLVEKLREKNYEISFLGNCAVLLEEFKKRNIPTYTAWAGTLPVSKPALLKCIFTWPFTKISLWRAFLRIQKRRNIDTVYMLSLTEKILLTPLALLMGKKVLWVEHQRIGKWITQNPLRPFFWFLSHFVHVITVSTMHKDSLHELGMPEDRLHMITNGIDTEMFHEKVEPLSWLSGEKRIGAIARLYKDKGLDILLRAFAEFCKNQSVHNTELFILGEGPEKASLQELAHELHIEKHTHFLVPYTQIPREDVPKFYKSLNVFVLPSRLPDPFGLVVAECMLVGTPTIITDVCGISSYLKNEENVLIVPAENISILASALQTLLYDRELAEKIRENGLKTAKELFSLERMVDEYEKYL